MILVDTSIWVNHLRTGDPVLAGLLDHRLVLGHPWVTGELALGNLASRERVLELLAGLPTAEVASAAETLGFIDAQQLYGLGIGYVDAQLLTATRLTPDSRLWTADKRLGAVAHRLNMLAEPGGPQGTA
ncbi:MAG: type II toxin-antitoxin system VapC family toxin [Acidimicrobiales bacterium]